MKSLIIVVLLAGFLRLYDISKLPNGLHWDEQDTGYQAYSLLKTGHDYFGNILPPFPHSFADWRTPVFIYQAIPSVKLLGLTPLSVRLPSAIYGIISVILIYYLGRLIFNPRVGLISSLVLATSPWHVLYGRQAVECNVMLMYLLLGLVFFYKNRPMLSALFMAITIASYSPAKLFVPILYAFLIIYHKKWHIPSLILFSVIAGPLLLISTFGPAGTRFHDLSIFTDPVTASTVDQKRLDAQVASGTTRQIGLTPRFIDKIIYNKITLPAQTFVSNYLRTYSTEYLFVKGDQELRHSPDKNSIGQFLISEIIPLIIGLYYIRSYKILILWFLIGPISSSLTRDGGPHAARTFLLLPAFIITIALGISKLKKPFIFGYCLLYFGAFIFTYHYFFSVYRFESAKPFQWGFDQVVQVAISNHEKYDNVYVDLKNDSALMAYLFNTKTDPTWFQSHLPSDVIPFQDVRAVNFDNIYLIQPGNRHWTDVKLTGKNLIIASAELPLTETIKSKLKTIEYPDSSPAYYVFEK